MIAVTVVAGECVDTFVSALMDFNFGAFVHVAVQRFVRFVAAVGNFVANQLIVDALTIGACELTGCTRAILFLRATHFVRSIATIIFAIATILRTNAFEVLARELLRRAGFVLRIAEFSLVRSIATIIVVIAQPSLIAMKERKISETFAVKQMKKKNKSTLTLLMHRPFSHVNISSPHG